MTGHWVSPVGHDRTRPVVKSCVWNLTGNDRTTKCWLTQWGLACWQAREPREKNPLSLVICILLVIGIIFIL